MSRKTIEVTHVVIESTKRAADVRSSLETSITVQSELALEAASELSIFLKRDLGAVQYEIGNSLSASTITHHELAAALYLPLRVVVYENDEGGSRIEYDLPSSLLGQFEDERVSAVARGLDVPLGRALSGAAGCARYSSSNS